MSNPSHACEVERVAIDLEMPDLRVVRIQSGDVVVVGTTPDAHAETAARATMLRSVFEEKGITGTLILVLSEGTTIESLPEDEMRKLGWVRA